MGAGREDDGGDRAVGWHDAGAARQRTAVRLAAALLAAVGLVVAVAHPDGLVAGGIAVGVAAIMLGLVHGRLTVNRQTLNVVGGFVGTGVNALLAALSGGATSLFIPLFGITPLVAAAVPLRLPLLVANLLVAFAGLLSPYLYDDVPSWFLLQAVGHASMWTLSSGAVYIIVTRLNRHQKDLEEADRLRMLFLRAISHELRRPLTVIRGNVETLTKWGEELPSAVRAELLGALEQQSGRLERLLRDLLDVDRLERGTEMLDRAPTRLDELVKDVVVALGSEDHDVDVGTLTPVTVSADRAKLERVIENLVVNAIRHTPGGTRVRVSSCADEGGAAVVVEDDGPGVPLELREEVFQPFVRGQDGPGATPGGTGIGLDLVRQLVLLHGGHVALDESEDLGGARFTVRLPRGGGPEE